MLKTDRSSQFDDVTPWSTEFCRRSRWFWSSASSESKIVVKFLHNDLKWPFPYSIPGNPQIINFNVLRLTKNNYNSYSNFFFLNNEMFTLEIHAEYNAATLQKKCITRFIIVQSHSGPPTSTPLNIFYIRACCPHHNENSCAYQRRKRHNCQYLSKFTTETSWKVYIYLHDCRSTGNSGIYAANSTFKSQKLQQKFQYFISDIQF